MSNSKETFPTGKQAGILFACVAMSSLSELAAPQTLLAQLAQQTLLIDALQRGAGDALVKQGAVVNPEGLEATSPLLVAVAMEHVKIVDLLLSHGARNDVRDAEGRDAVTLARLHKSAFPFASLV